MRDDHFPAKPPATKTTADRRKTLYPNAPRTGVCKICGAPRRNAIHDGTGVVVVTCDDCRAGMLSKRRRVVAPKPDAVDDLLTIPKLKTEATADATAPKYQVFLRSFSFR